MLNWTKENRNKLFGKKNSLVYDEKEDFMFIVNRNVKINIKGYFRFDDCKKCEILKKNLAYERGQKDQFKGEYSSLAVTGSVLVENNVNCKREALEDENDVIENKLKVCERSKFLVSLENLMRKEGLSVLVEGTKKKASNVSVDKHDDTVEDMNNFVSLANENSSMVLCLRNRAMRMKDCVYDLKWKDKNLGQLVNNEKAVRREMAEIRVNECKFNKRLDRVQQEKKNLVELLTWLKSSNDYVSRVEELVNQRTRRQRYFGRNFRIPLVQKAPCNSKLPGARDNGSEI